MDEAARPELGSGMSSHAPAEHQYQHFKAYSFADWSEGDPPEREWLVDGLGKSTLGQRRGGTFVPIGSDEAPRPATRVKHIRRA